RFFFTTIVLTPRSPLFPYTTLFRSDVPGTIALRREEIAEQLALRIVQPGIRMGPGEALQRHLLRVHHLQDLLGLVVPLVTRHRAPRTGIKVLPPLLDMIVQPPVHRCEL